MHWTDSLIQPKTILGAYGGKAPSLDSFVIHALKVESSFANNQYTDGIRIAGEFTELPHTLPPGWIWNGKPIAYLIFDLMEVRSSSIDGVARPRTPMKLSLEPTQELWATPPVGMPIYYKSFRGSGVGIDINIVAAHIRVIAGQRALKGYDWARPVEEPEPS